MTRWVAFLRGINVGGHTVKMERLRALFEGLGFTDVRTFIASGNVVFDAKGGKAAALEARIETHLAAGLGWEAATFLRSIDEVRAIAAHDPFADTAPAEGDRTHVAFLRAPPDADTERAIAERTTAHDLLATRDREVYWLCRIPWAESTVPRDLGRLLTEDMTLRNINTVRRMARKFG